MDASVCAIIGDFGSSKTLFLTYLANLNKDNRKIFANFKLYDLEYTPMSFKKIATFPDELENAIVLIDEGQVGAHAYDFFKKDVRNMALFITQIRKRNIVVFWTSQLFDKVAKPLRDYTHYVFEMYKEHPDTHIKLKGGKPFVRVFDKFGNYFINEMYLDLTSFFDKYDTKEIIFE